MRVCIYEDQGVYALAPLTLTRPAFDLWCGASTLLQRWCRYLPGAEFGFLVRPALADLTREQNPGRPVNDPAWLQSCGTLWINARWLPPARPALDDASPRVGWLGRQVAYAVVPPRGAKACRPELLEEGLAEWSVTLPRCPAGGWMIDYPWHLVEHNADVLCRDFPGPGDDFAGVKPSPGLRVVGPRGQLATRPGVRLEPLVVVDTTRGPVFLDRGAEVQAFSRLEGPCYVGRGARVRGARVGGSTVGPGCEVGGEVEASILHARVSKPHRGYVGHSYLGGWVRLGAGTEVADRREDQGTVRVPVNGDDVASGLARVGAFVGDHSAAGPGAVLAAGSVVGAFCQLFASAAALPRLVPSFTAAHNGRLREVNDLDALLGTTAVALRRHGFELTAVQAEYLRWLHDWTILQRDQEIAANQVRRLRDGA